MENKFGKTSYLKISSLLKNGEAILDNVYFTAPFKIMKPFKLRSNSLSVMLLTASSGIMEGDVQEIDILVREGTNIEFISQAFEKIHKMGEGKAERITNIKVEKNGSLYYKPLPTIPFKDSTFISKLEVDLENESSKFIMSEILSCGRAGSGERFEYSLYENLVNIRKNGKLIYRDNAIYNPKIMNMESVGMYEGYSHFASMVFCNCKITSEVFESIRNFIYDNDSITGDITHTNYGDVVIRVLGNSGEKLNIIFEEIIKMV